MEKMNEFNPLDKVPELIQMLQAYDPILHKKSDEGYRWLNENSFCIEIPNPSGGDSILIVYEDLAEFTISYSYYHSHYSANDFEYDCMCKIIFDLLNSKRGSAALFRGSENKWFSSTLVEKDKTSLPPEEIFTFVFKCDDYVEELREKGGAVQFVFWDGNLNRMIKL